jgi:hypothetical protein
VDVSSETQDDTPGTPTLETFDLGDAFDATTDPTPPEEAKDPADAHHDPEKPGTRRSHRPRKTKNQLNLAAQSTPGPIKSVMKGLFMGIALLDTFQSFPIKDIDFSGPLPLLNPKAADHQMGVLSPDEALRLCELQDLDLLNEALNPQPEDQF